MVHKRFVNALKIRDAVPDDHAYFFSTYLKYNWYADQTSFTKQVWMKLQHERLEKILKNDIVKVACLPDDPDVIIAYGFYDFNNPFYIVKQGWMSHSTEIKEMLLNALESETDEAS